MRPRPVVSSLLAVAVVAGILASSGSPAGAQLPRTATYRATLDVSGFVQVRVTRDDTAECAKGRDMGLDYRADFELGSPRRINVVIAGGTAFSNFASKAGGAVHEGEVFSYNESNECPPRTPVVPGEPSCSKHRGTLRASLTPTPEVGDDDLTPLVRGVSIALQRTGGGSQDPECRSLLGVLEPRVGPHLLSTLATAGEGISVPLGVTDATFRKLRRGKAVRRLVRLNGACDAVLISFGPAVGSAAAAPSRCTVSGKIYVSVRRLR